MRIFMVVSILLVSLFSFANGKTYIPGAPTQSDLMPIIIREHLQQRHKAHRATLLPPFQGKRRFCSDESKQEYTVSIKGNNVTISYATVSIKGSFKNGLLFTNDPHEMEYRHYAGKHNYGKYYILKADYFSVLNAENGEYFYYTLCKKI